MLFGIYLPVGNYVDGVIRKTLCITLCEAWVSLLRDIKAKRFCSDVAAAQELRKEAPQWRGHIKSLWALLNTNKNNSLRSNTV